MYGFEQKRGQIESNKLFRRKQIQIGSLNINGTGSKANISMWLGREALPVEQLLYSNRKMN